MDDDTGEYPVPVLVPRAELEALARLVLENAEEIGRCLNVADILDRRIGRMALGRLIDAARSVLPSLPAVDSVDRD